MAFERIVIPAATLTGVGILANRWSDGKLWEAIEQFRSVGDKDSARALEEEMKERVREYESEYKKFRDNDDDHDDFDPNTGSDGFRGREANDNNWRFPGGDDAAFDGLDPDGLQAAGISFFVGGLVLSALARHPAFAAAGTVGGLLAAGTALARE